MTEVAYYCNKGYAVLAYDSLGCDRSEGKNIRSFYTGAECVVAAYIGAKCHKYLKDLPVYLVGHSWGGYSVLCASQQIDVKGVVAFSAFNSPAKVIYSLASSYSNKMLKPALYLMMPSLALIAACKNTRTGSKNAAKALEKSKVPALLVWGEKDAVVNEKCSAACIASGDNVQKLIVPDRAHNVYNTVAAEGKLAELTNALTKVSKGEFSGEQAISYFASFDYTAATEEDLDVMQKTVDFIESL
jgi:pimeloyl-ACP methyl ester carboxylesterase